MGNPVTVTLSSVGVSRAVNLDWMQWKSPVSMAITAGTSSAIIDYTVQFTLDDLMRSSNPSWASVSSAIGSSAQHYVGATTFDNGGLNLSFPNPIAGLRLSSTTISSGSLSADILQGG